MDDQQMNADKVIEQLTSKNFELEEQIKQHEEQIQHLKLDIHELEQLHQMDEEIIEIQKESERELQQKNQELVLAIAAVSKQNFGFSRFSPLKFAVKPTSGRARKPAGKSASLRGDHRRIDAEEPRLGRAEQVCGKFSKNPKILGICGKKSKSWSSCTKWTRRLARPKERRRRSCC